MDRVYWRDFDINFERDQATGDVKVLENFDAIESSLANIFMTMRGSRRMLPSFAVDIYRILFEPVDKYTGQLLGERIVDAISKWERRISIDKLDIEADPDKNMYNIYLYYRINGDFSDEAQKTFSTILRAI